MIHNFGYYTPRKGYKTVKTIAKALLTLFYLLSQAVIVCFFLFLSIQVKSWVMFFVCIPCLISLQCCKGFSNDML